MKRKKRQGKTIKSGTEVAFLHGFRNNALLALPFPPKYIRIYGKPRHDR
jgi:hypothetical protein